MKRYPAFDPPEYVDWSPDAEVMRRYAESIDREPVRGYVERLDAPALLDLYAGLLRFRLHDITLKRWVRQGVISKAWLGTGEEATTIGPVHALRRGDGSGEGRGDVVGPMIRNAGACHEMGMDIADMFRGYLASDDGPTRGRDLHIGSRAHGVIAPISMVGALAPVIAGYGLAFRKSKSDRVGLTWVGDGATKTGEVHEAFNFAAVQHLPVIYIIQNNKVALGTRLEEHHAAADLSSWPRAYGVESLSFDGNNVLDAYGAACRAVERCRAGDGPVFLLADTFRMAGHATHDEREARELFAAETFREWGRRDPIGCYETWLIDGSRDLRSGERCEPGACVDTNRQLLAEVEERVTQEVEAAAETALASRERMPGPESAGRGVYGDEGSDERSTDPPLY